MKNEVGINAKVEDIKTEIDNILVNAQLPVCLVDYLLTEILNNVRSQRIEAIQREKNLLEELEKMKEAPTVEKTEVFNPEVIDGGIKAVNE